jgi:hypothetical protein
MHGDTAKEFHEVTIVTPHSPNVPIMHITTSIGMPHIMLAIQMPINGKETHLVSAINLPE